MTNTDSPNPRVAVLGLGSMGSALAIALAKTHQGLQVWNRTPGRADTAVTAGAHEAASAADAIESSEIIVICVVDYEAVRDILEPTTSLLRGRTVVNLTSGSSGEAREMAAWVETQGARYLDGAVLAAPADVATPSSAVLLSGTRAGYEEAQTSLETLSPNAAFLGEDAGLSAIHDVAVLAMMWSVLNGFLHGAALLRRAGVSASAYLPIARSGINTTSGWLGGYAAQIDVDNHPGDDSTITTHVAAMQHLLDETLGARVDPTVPEAFKALGDRAVQAGLADNGYTAILKLLVDSSASDGHL